MDLTHTGAFYSYEGFMDGPDSVFARKVDRFVPLQTTSKQSNFHPDYRLKVIVFM